MDQWVERIGEKQVRWIALGWISLHVLVSSGIWPVMTSQ